MAGNVKKGFGTYLFIFLMMIIAAFLIMFVVMMGQPFTTIMGYQYFSYTNSEQEFTTTTNGDSINFDSIDVVRITSDYADISLQKNTELTQSFVISFKHNAKGFIKSDEKLGYSYKVDVVNEDGVNVLDVEINETQKGLFIQKDVRIDFYVPYFNSSDGSHNLQGKAFEFITNSGDILIGNKKEISVTNTDLTLSQKYINPSQLTIKSKSGSVYLYKYFDDSKLANLSFTTSSSYVKIYDNIKLLNQFSYTTSNGKFDGKGFEINPKGQSNINVGNGSFDVKIFDGDIDFTIKGGRFTISDFLYGSLISNESQEGASGKIDIGVILGNISMPFLGNSSVNIELIVGQAYLEGEGASINVDLIEDYSWIKTTSGNIKVCVAKDTLIQSKSGNIVCYYQSDNINQELNFGSTSGKISLYLNPSLACQINVYDRENQLREKNVSVVYFDVYENPCVINGGTKPINFVSDGKIVVDIYNIA